MSIPGLGGLGRAAPTASFSAPSAAATTTYPELAPNSEWRFEVAIGRSIEVKLLSGSAEIFGTELALNHTYTFRGTKSAIFTWHGCRIEVQGFCEEYTAEETPMIQYVNTHFALEKLRNDHPEGPRVLIVGPNNAGKTSLARLLTAYAIRQGRQPMVINTDSREGLLSIPGTLTATPFASILDVEAGWGSGPASGPGPVPEKLPLCYYYGLPSPEDNTRLYKPLVSRLALAATSRLAVDGEARRAGLIIDTSGVVSQGKGGYELISHIVSEFSVNVLLTLGSERLYSDIQRKFSTYKTTANESISIVKLDKSGGCVDRDDTFMQQTREAAIKEYFFGDAKRILSPHNQYINFDDPLIYKISDGSPSQPSFLPGGSEEEEETNASSSSPLIYSPISPTPEMLHCVLAVMYASRHDPPEMIRDASVMGFVYVAEVDEKRRRMRVLAPTSARVVDRPWVWGGWPEGTVGVIG